MVATYRDFYLHLRPHQGKDNELLIRHKVKPSVREQPDQELLSLRDIRCEQRLGGLLKHYSRKAA